MHNHFKPVFFYLFLFLFTNVLGQNNVKGVVRDTKGKPIIGANVYLKGTYDGSTSNGSGEFNFKTSETGNQTLVVSYISFETFNLTADVGTMKSLIIELKEDVNTLDAVVLSAGTFEAGDNSTCSCNHIQGFKYRYFAVISCIKYTCR